jgi:hypothetical protein
MKKIILLPLLCILTKLSAQEKSFHTEGKLTHVRYWGSLSIMIGSSFFDATQDSIILQIGAGEFEEMKKKCSAAGWPKGLYQSSLDEEEDKAHEEKMNRLKKYHIAAYTHIYNNMVFDRYVILRVPYEENRDWDPAIQWTGNIYFLLKEKDVLDAVR